MTSRPALTFGIESSLSGKSWRWRGGNMDLGDAASGLEDDIVTQLLLSRGVPREDIDRHRTPSLRAFLPDPSAFRDMDAAAERLAQAILTGETVTVYGDYDPESSETFTISLTSPEGANFGASTQLMATGTISNDD